MNDVAKEWVEKADADFDTAQRELAAGSRPNYDAVCFHAQQCVEKLMKGFLITLGSVPPRTHDLASLSHLISASCPSWAWPPEDLRLLTRAAVTFRYPGESAEREEAQAALDACTRLRLHLRELITDG